MGLPVRKPHGGSGRVGCRCSRGRWCCCALLGVVLVQILCVRLLLGERAFVRLQFTALDWRDSVLGRKLGAMHARDVDLMLPELVEGESGLPMDPPTTECDGLPQARWERNLAAPAGHPGSQAAWGVPELATRCTVQDVTQFVGRTTKDSMMWRREDATVAARYAALEAKGDPRLMVIPEVHLRGEEVWREAWRVAEVNIGRAMSVPGHHWLWEIYQEYPRYDIRDCPVTTPECLAWLSPGLREGAAAGSDATLAYRKCCVEHRRLRNVLMWTLHVLEVRLPAEVGRYALTYGALISSLRDGGAMSAMDTDIDVHVVEQHAPRILQALNKEPWPPYVGAVYIYEGDKLIVGQTTERPPKFDGTRWTTTRQQRQDQAPLNHDVDHLRHHTHGDSHVELYIKDGLYKAKPLWKTTVQDALAQYSGNHTAQAAIRDLYSNGVELLDPVHPCFLWNRVVQCPAKGNELLSREYDGTLWQTPLRTPLVHGLFGLSWCGSPEEGDTCRVKRLDDQTLRVMPVKLSEVP